MPARKRNRAQVSAAKAKTSKASTKKASKASTSKAVSKTTKKRDAKAADKKNDDVKVRNLVMSNGAPVDHLVPNAEKHEVVCDGPKSAPMNANLMFSDCVNNNNKFYIVQGLKEGSNYYLWTRWGRVGVDGNNAKRPCSSLNDLSSHYQKTLKTKKSKGYTQIEIDYEEEKKEGKDTKKSKKNKKQVSSKLSDEVQNLLRFIFDMKAIEKSVMKVGLNVKKLPLGKLSKKTILDGYSVLKKIEKALKKKSNTKELGDLSSEFYTYIPHDFQFQKMSNFIINTEQKLKEKLDLVESLSDIRIAAEINNEVEDMDSDANVLDAKYKKMKCEIKPLPKSNKHYNTLVNTIKTCSQAGKVTILDVFEI